MQLVSRTLAGYSSCFRGNWVCLAQRLLFRSSSWGNSPIHWCVIGMNPRLGCGCRVCHWIYDAPGINPMRIAWSGLCYWLEGFQSLQPQYLKPDAFPLFLLKRQNTKQIQWVKHPRNLLPWKNITYSLDTVGFPKALAAVVIWTVGCRQPRVIITSKQWRRMWLQLIDKAEVNAGTDWKADSGCRTASTDKEEATVPSAAKKAAEKSKQGTSKGKP